MLLIEPQALWLSFTVAESPNRLIVVIVVLWGQRILHFILCLRYSVVGSWVAAKFCFVLFFVFLGCLFLSGMDRLDR